ncbi:MAG: type II secretion system minor pseudopilin GspK [Pseudomonadota bacterium]
MRPTHPRRQSGAALLTAMLIAALAAVVMIGLSDAYQLHFRRTTVMVSSEVAMQYALGAESWAHDILRQDLQDTQSDHRLEAWASSLPPLPIDDGLIEGTLEDLNGRFNLNNLAGGQQQAGAGQQQGGAGQQQGIDENAVAQFQRLLTALEIDPALAYAAADWIDSNQEVAFPDGAEDDFYTGQEPAYRTANVAITNPSELLAIGTFDVAAWRALRPYVTALPPGTAINPNTALPVVLQSLSENISPSDAQGIFEQAGITPYENLDDLSQQIGLEGGGAASVTVNSNYFRLIVRVTVGATLFTMYSLLERDNQGQVWTRFRTFHTE